MNNRPAIIIIEGFWNIGKTSVAKLISTEQGFSLREEPNHLSQAVSEDASEWYISRHLNALDELSGQTDVVAERSLLSSAAYLYARHGSQEKIDSLMSIFVNFYSKVKPLVVFIYGDHDLVTKQAQGVNDSETKDLLNNAEFVDRYEYFYRHLLPLKYGIVPLMCKVNEVAAGDQESIAAGIVSAVDHDRIGQVNVACYRRSDSELEFLLLKRNPRKGAFWQVVTGGVKAKQSLLEAVHAELSEELSLNVIPGNLLKSEFSFHYVGAEGYELNEFVFGYELEPDDTIVLSDEHTEYKFVNLDQALELLKYDSNKEALKSIQNELSTLT